MISLALWIVSFVVVLWAIAVFGALILAGWFLWLAPVLAVIASMMGASDGLTLIVLFLGYLGSIGVFVYWGWSARCAGRTRRV